MGVNTRINLPPFVRLHDVATVLGAITGMPMHKEPLSGGSWAAWIEGVTRQSSVIPECAEIVWQTPDGQSHWVLYHFESETGDHLLCPPMTPFWKECGRQLVEFFGGTVDYNDCDTVDVDFAVPPRPESAATNGRAWIALQKRFMDLGEEHSRRKEERGEQ
jgi:hypothetical protein